MAVKNMEWYFKDIRKFELVEGEIPSPGEDEVVIEVMYAGICGSDLHAYTGKHPLVKPGKILGHEFVGKIFKKGGNVEELQEGDWVVVEPSLTCGKCYNCAHGRYNICRELDVIGCTKTNGGFQKYVVVPANKVYKIEGLPPKRAVLTEPFAVGIHGVRRSSFKPGDEALVIGCGPIGAFVTIFLYLSGARKIIAVDPIEERLIKIRKLCPGVITAKPDSLDLRSFSREGPDVVFECVGSDDSINFAIKNARKGTDIILLGVPRSVTRAELIFVQDGELNLKGSLMYTRDDFLIAMDLLKKNDVDYDSIITNVFAFEDLPEAFEYALNNKSKVLKVLIKIGDFEDKNR